jgi:hypothetical protein
MSNLARAEGMRPQSMGSAIALLEAAGFVSGAQDPNETAAKPFCRSRTGAGNGSGKEGRAARQDWLFRTLRARFSPQEQKDLAATVELLRRPVDD